MIRRTPTRMALCIGMLAVNLLFIWGNSLMPARVSELLSGWVHRVLSLILPGSMEGATGHGLLRKLAHFSEFCALGALLGWLFAMLLKKTWAFALPSLACGCLAACVDELLQHLSAGRNPSITDVGIDSAGVLVGIGMLCLGYTTVKKQIKHNTTGGKQQ